MLRQGLVVFDLWLHRTQTGSDLSCEENEWIRLWIAALIPKTCSGFNPLGPTWVEIIASNNWLLNLQELASLQGVGQAEWHRFQMGDVSDSLMRDLIGNASLCQVQLKGFIWFVCFLFWVSHWLKKLWYHTLVVFWWSWAQVQCASPSGCIGQFACQLDARCSLSLVCFFL